MCILIKIKNKPLESQGTRTCLEQNRTSLGSGQSLQEPAGSASGAPHRHESIRSVVPVPRKHEAWLLAQLPRAEESRRSAFGITASFPADCGAKVTVGGQAGLGCLAGWVWTQEAMCVCPRAQQLVGLRGHGLSGLPSPVTVLHLFPLLPSSAPVQPCESDTPTKPGTWQLVRESF